MKNRSFLIVIITVLSILPQFAFSANQYYAGDTLYVWARSGLNMRDSADIKAGKIQTLPFGTMVIVQDSKYPFEQETQKIRVINSRTIDGQKHPGYSLQGNWIKVITGDTEGYLFDGFLSKFQPLKIEEIELEGKMQLAAAEQIPEYFERIYGKLKKFNATPTNKWQSIQRTIFGNGATYEDIQYEVAGSEQIIIPDMDLEEAYLFFNMCFLLEKSNEPVDPEHFEEYPDFKSLKNVSEDHLHFIIDEIGNSLIIKQTGSFIVVNIDYMGC